MAVVALIVAIVAALAAVGSFWYARLLDGRAKDAVEAAQKSAAAAERSATAVERSAVAGEDRATLESGRRHEELTPQFRVEVIRERPRVPGPMLTVVLVGPPELGRVDELTVTIQDDPRLRVAMSGEGATPEQITEMVWGPYQFTFSTDAASHVASGEGMQVGEKRSFSLYRTRPPSWSALKPESRSWQKMTGTLLRLQLEARREGWEPWTLAREIDSAAEPPTVEVPGGPISG